MRKDASVKFVPVRVKELLVSSPVPASPPANRVRRPSWLDLRIIVGVLLVLMSVVLVTRIVAAADRSVRVWALARDVAAGTTLTTADVRPARVRLFDSAPVYLQTTRSPAGHAVSRSFRAGELLPAAALDGRPAGVLVSIPVKPENAPAVTRGQLVDVWSTAKGCPPIRVLGGVAVQEIRANGGGALSVSAGALQLIVRIRADQAERVVAALGTEATIRLVLLDGPVPAGGPDPISAANCLAPGTPGGFRQTSDLRPIGGLGPVDARRPGSSRTMSGGRPAGSGGVSAGPLSRHGAGPGAGAQLGGGR
jgi:hypothetical protein